MRKRTTKLDGGIETAQPASVSSLRWPETGGTLAHWRYSRSTRGVKHLSAARLRHAAVCDVIDAAEDILL